MSAVVIPFTPPPEPEVPKPDCSFCGTSYAKAKKMVAVGNAAICDRCVAQAATRAATVEVTE